MYPVLPRVNDHVKFCRVVNRKCGNMIRYRAGDSFWFPTKNCHKVICDGAINVEPAWRPSSQRKKEKSVSITRVYKIWTESSKMRLFLSTYPLWMWQANVCCISIFSFTWVMIHRRRTGPDSRKSLAQEQGRYNKEQKRFVRSWITFLTFSGLPWPRLSPCQRIEGRNGKICGRSMDLKKGPFSFVYCLT